jgi:hypothetical protein
VGVQNPNQRVKLKPKPKKQVVKFVPKPGPDVVHPVTPKQRAKIERKVMLANRAYKAGQQAKAENKAEGHYTNIAGLTFHPEAGLKPGLQILNTVAIPVHAVAGAAEQATGRGFKGLTPARLLAGAKQGIKQKTTYSDVLKTAGVQNKYVRGVGGFAGDVLLDPTTYVTFGTTSIAREAATKAGTRVAAKALKQGMTKDVASRLAKQAAKKAATQAEAKGGIQRAITAGVGKRKVKIVPLPAKRAKAGLKADIAQAVNPRYVHPLADAAAQKEVKSAHLEARAQASTGTYKTVHRAQQLAKLTPSEQKQVIDAIEQGKVGKLPDHLKQPAIRVRSDFRHMARTERQQGILGATIENYFPHVRRQDVHAEDKVVAVKGMGSNPARLGSSKARKIKEPLAQIRQTSPDIFTEDLAHAYAMRGKASAEGVARSKLYKEVAATGRKLTPNAQIDTAKELVYRVTPHGLKPLVREGGDKIDLKAIEKAANGAPGQHVILNKQVVDNLQQRLSSPGGGQIAKGLIDRPMGGLKSTLTVLNPPYHIRNLVGDSWNSYLSQSFPHLVGNFKHAVQGQRAIQHIHGAEASLALNPSVKPVAGHIAIKGEKVPYEQFVKRARDAGVIDSGFYGRDIVELVKGPSGPGHHPLDTIRRIGQARENLVRLNTFASALKRGLSDREAARVATEHHFDYGDLSGAEKTLLRRIFPFYTFTARNTPLQARKLVTRPGKYANLEKLREELGKATGLPVGTGNDYQRKLKDYEQLGMPFPIPGVMVDGKKQLGYLALPTTDLNRLTANPLEQVKLVGQSATPLKLPLEEALNYSLFFRSAIDQGRPVSAPDWVGGLPQSVKDELGVVKVLDKQSGKHIWKWKAKVDYAVKQIPQVSAALQFMSTGKNRRGQSTGAKILSQSGIRVQPYDPLQAEIDVAYKGLTYLKNKLAITDAGSPERKRLNVKFNKQLDKIAKLKTKAGYKIVGPQKTGGGGSLLSQSQGPSVSAILGHDAPTVNDILGP